MPMFQRVAVLALSSAFVALALPARAQTPPPTQNPPVPLPFPVGGAPPATSGTTAAKPGAQAPVTGRGGGSAPMPQTAGATNAALAPPVVYPAAEFIQEFDAGRGQKYYLYGTDQPFEAIVEYYRGVFKDGGDEVSRTPAMRLFELGRFDSDTMAYPPSVVVKDYVWNGSEGYLVAQGTTPKRYRTVIQIVPVKTP